MPTSAVRLIGAAKAAIGLLAIGVAGAALAGADLPPIGEGGVVVAAANEPAGSSDHGRSDPLPGPRDPEIAVREEFDMALAAGTADALMLFIRRHADHPLAEKARQALNELVAPERPE